MFRDLVAASKECQRHTYRIEISKIVRLARKRDAQAKAQGAAVPKALNFTLGVFHESRCGSTLVANTLIGMNPSHHRTYSESTPPAFAFKNVCGQEYSACTPQVAAQVFRDVIYLMSRTNDPAEERVFFKFQSATTLNIQIFQEAFPDVPWLFVYRDPVQVMMSHVRDGLERANCVRQRNRPSQSVAQLAAKKDMHASTMEAEYFCAAHLATLTESAMRALQVPGNKGIPVEYSTLPDRLYEDILPKIGVHVGEEEIDRIKTVAAKYAKGRQGSRAGEFQQDSEKKEEEASDKVKEAAALFLQESFDFFQSHGN
jgi:hypothetical protein